jgi:hypothetical protein
LPVTPPLTAVVVPTKSPRVEWPVKLNVPDCRTAFGAGHVSTREARGGRREARGGAAAMRRPTLAIMASVGAVLETLIGRRPYPS